MNVMERVEVSGTRASGISVIASAMVWEIVLKPGPKSALQMEAKLPFVFYEIKSEHQPSANGATTR